MTRIKYKSDGMDKPEFHKRFGEGEIDLSPEEREVKSDEKGYLISLNEVPSTVELSQLLNILEDYSPEFVPKENIYLKINGMGAYQISEAKLDVKKYTRLKGVFSRRGIEFYKMNNLEDVEELTQVDLMHTVKFSYENDISNFI